MKLFKKVLSVVASLALVATLIPANVSAAADVVDFEDGNIPAAIRMATMDDGSPDGDVSILSVVDYEGSKMLKIERQDPNQHVKFRVDVYGLLGDKFADVSTISYDIILESRDADGTPGWNGGTIASTPTGPSNWANNDEFVIEEYENLASPIKNVSVNLKKGFEFKDSAAAFFLHMNWGAANINTYIDNVKFLDAAGNVIPLAVAEATVEVEEVAEVEEVKTETAVPKTGETNFAVYFLGAAVVLLAGAVVLNKRKNFAK